MDLTNVLAKLKVIGTSAVTVIAVLALIIQAVIEELGDQLDASWVAVLLRILTVLTAIVAVIRRVTPVSEVERGLLPPKG